MIALENSAWQVVRDGDGLPMIQSPTGTLLRVQERVNGRWQHPKSPEVVTRFLVQGANLKYQKNIADKAVAEDDEATHG